MLLASARRIARGAVTRRNLLLIVASAPLHLALAQPPRSVATRAQARAFDLVIAHGRVIDPASGLDAERDIGVRDGRITAISRTPLRGTRTLDARGLVVAPGFIDLHAHGQDPENYRHYALDGVTTALELELGTEDVDAWYAARAGTAVVNYGVSVGHARSRGAVMHDSGQFYPSGPGARKAASDSELAAIEHLVDRGLAAGALAVGFGLSYTPGASHWEAIRMFKLAAAYGAPAVVHLRYLGAKEPTSSVAALEEVLAASAITGAPLHVCHVQSIGLRSAPQLLTMIGDARRRGLDVTTEAYPYTAGATSLETALFDPGWQDALGVSYGDLEWAATGERLTESTFRTYRAQRGAVIIHFIPEAIVDEAIASPLTIVASDGRLQNGRGHPRSAGTFARVLGRYVRERKTMALSQAIAKMTIMPARRLEARAPMMRRKGRIAVGADADITIFDPERVADRATYREPALDSEGFVHVLVGGASVVRDGKIVDDAHPGREVRAPRGTPRG